MGSKAGDRPRRWVVRGAVLFTAIVGGLMLFSFLEHSMIYFPEKEVGTDPSEVGLAFEDVHLRSSDGVAIHGWWVPSDAAGLTVLYLHGNAGNISNRVHRLHLLHDLGVSVLIIDYPGYGRSEGKPSEEGLYRAAETALEDLRRRRGLPPGRIVCFGKSLGGAVAVDLASRQEVGGLILESSFTSMKEMARRTVPVLPVHLLVRSLFDSLEKLPRVACPLLVIHGDADDVVPYELGRQLFETARGEKEFLAVPGAGHNDVMEVGGGPYRDRLRTFLERLRPRE